MNIFVWGCFVVLTVAITANLVLMPIEFRSEIIPKMGECVVKIDMLEERVSRLEEYKAEIENKLNYQNRHNHKFLFFKIK